MLERVFKIMLYWMTIFVCRFVLSLFSKIEVIGIDNIPKKTPFILASNHLSNLDPPLLAACSPRKLNFLAKKELFRKRFFNWYFRSVSAIPINRDNASSSTLRECLKVLKTEALILFPQGSRENGLDQAFNGVGFICRKSKRPVIAAKIYGTDILLPKGMNFPKRGKIKLIFDIVDNIKASDNNEEVTTKVIEKIKSM